MDPYTVQSTDRASSELEKLDPTIAHRIVLRIHWLSENLDSIRAQSLTGGLTGLFKLRVGDYRVIYEVLRDQRIVVIHAIGHRRDIYK